MNSVKNSNLKENGQSMVELAVSLVFLLTLIAGVVDLGRAFFTHIALRDAAQEGALFGSINADTKSDSDVAARVEDVLSDRVAPADLTVSVTPPLSSSSCAGDSIQVTVSFDNFPITMPFLGAVIGQQVDLSANVVDTILSPPCP
jgi:Flp pilus assembly protein TadG